MEEDEAPAVRAPRRRWWRALGWLLLGLVAVVAATIAVLDTGPGHRLIADRVARLKPSSGLRIRIGRIDGSIWNRVVLRDVQLFDPRGRFFAAPELRLDWHPLAWTHNRLDVDRLAADLIELPRLPKLRSRPGAPLLPGFDIRIGRLQVARLRLGREVGGTAADMRLLAHADLRDRRAAIGLAAASTRGDRATLDLDAAPDEGRFRLAADIRSPAGGVIGGLAGTRRPLALVVGGRGDWRAWDGRARAIVSGHTLAALALQARAGRYALSGELAPAPFVSGKLQRLSSPRLRVAGHATYAARLLDGRLAIASPALAIAATGKVDLARSSFGKLAIDAHLLRPPALFPNMTGRDVRLRVGLDGPFRGAAFTYAFTAPHVAFDDTGFDQVRAVGAGHISRLPIALPIRLSAARVTGLGDVAGGILARLAIAGTLKVDAKLLTGEGLALTSDKLRGRLGLRLDLVTGQYDIALSGGLQRYLIPGLGIVDVDSRLSAVPGPGGLGTIVAGRGSAIVRRFDNAFLSSLAGGLPRIDTALVRSRDGVLHFSNLVLTGPAIRITGTGLRRRDGSFQFEGTGRQATYGPFRIQLDGQIDHPQVRLVFDRPVDGLGLRATSLDLDPVAAGFTFRAAGRSYLGPFASGGLIRVPSGGGATTIEIATLDVSGTHARGILRADPGGLTGTLNVAGGGIAGTIGFAPQGTIQRIEPRLTLAAATLAADEPVRVRRGTIAGAILLDPAGLSLSGQVAAQGVRRGGISLARLAASASLAAGRGSVTLAAAGSRGRAFDLKGQAAIESGRATITGGGTIDQRPLTLAGPAIVTAEAGGYRLAPTQLAYDGGKATLAGRYAPDALALEAGLTAMPLSVLDIFAPQLGLAGQASGRLAFAQAGGAAPTGRLDLTLRGLSRSGLVRSSQPIDVAVAAALTANGLAGRAVALSNGTTIGRAQMRIAPLGGGGGLVDRLTRAALFAQLRYVGPGDTLWRLTGVETIDLSGPFSVAADIGGTLATPAIRGVVRTDGGRLESAVTGTVVEHIQATGRFDGSRLLLDRMSGTTPGGGTVAGKGSFDLSAANGLGIDLALQTDNAQLLARDDIGATVTGPLTIRSSGSGGTIGGNLVLERARYRLGAAAAAQVAHLGVTEVNQPDDLGGDIAPPVPWKLDLTARARNRLAVTGLGLDSEWRANLTIRGDVDNPAIGGDATLIQGRYEFAGRRFDIARGTIRFSGSAPPDPALDITAQANVQGLNAAIRVTGTGLRPQISFESVPALPEDELLARLLFGTSIANLSAPEALQLATAVASLRSSGGGGGFNLDPINAVRKAVHLDRLRILPADVTTGQKTAVAAGKYIGRRTYVEVITDGAGYSATSVEYRITRWLSVLSTISTIGRQSANVRVSKDY